MANSVSDPDIVIRPIRFEAISVNHRRPSGPVTIETGPAPGVGSACSTTAPVDANAGPAPVATTIVIRLAVMARLRMASLLLRDPLLMRRPRPGVALDPGDRGWHRDRSTT